MKKFERRERVPAIVEMKQLISAVFVCLCVVLFGSVSQGAVFFEDNFDGSALDAAKWNTDIATSGLRFCQPRFVNPPINQWIDASAFPCPPYQQPIQVPYGIVTVSNGEAYFGPGTDGVTFAYVWAGPLTRPSPFPSTGDFTFEMRMKYNSPVQFYVTGILVGYADDTNPPNPSNQQVVLEVQGTGIGLMGTGSTFRPNDGAYHTYRLEFVNGNYTLFVDGTQAVGPMQGVRANSIWVGYPGIVDAGPNVWTDFTMDYVRVTVPPVQNPSNGHWYQRFDTSMTWHQARDFCDAKGGYLATITSQPENYFVYGTLAFISPQWAWLGATDEVSEGVWRWVTSEPFVDLSWASGEPNNCSNIEHYLMYFTPPDGRAGFWNDLGTGFNSLGVPGGCGCGGCQGEPYPMSTICEWGGFCTQAPAGIVGWWPGDGSANDIINGNNGTLVGDVRYGPGKVSSAFLFTGGENIDQGIDVPAAPVLDVKTAITIAAWIKPMGVFAPIVEYKAPDYPNQPFGIHFWQYSGDGRPDSLYVNLVDTNHAYHQLWAHGTLTVGEWNHVAMTYDQQGYCSLYVNGAQVATQFLGVFELKTDKGLYIGYRPQTPFDGWYSFNGGIDEVAIFNRALTNEEIRVIYLTGAAGKCKPAPAQCAVPPAGLVSWWPAEGNGADLTGLNPGSLTGTTTFGGGMVGQAFAFPDTFDGVLIANSPSLELQSFTIDAWVKRDRLDVAGSGPACNEGEIFVYGQDGYGLGMCANGSLFLTKVGVDAVYNGIQITDTAWHHVAVTKSGSTVFFYVDGVANGPHTYDPGFLFYTPTAIGNRGDSIVDPASGNPPANFFGLIDEVQIFNRPLSGDEVRSIYHAAQTGKCRQLPVTIDIRPGGFPNSINPFSQGVIPVAILTTGTFNAAIVDAQTVRFGPNNALPASFLLQDVDLDGDLDLVLQFRTQQTGIVCGMTSATLTGTTIDGVAISGTDSVRTVNCR